MTDRLLLPTGRRRIHPRNPVRTSCSMAWRAWPTDRSQWRFRHSSRNVPLKLSTQAVCTGCPGSMNRRRTLSRSDQSNIAFLVSSGPPSRMISSATPNRSARSSRKSATLEPGIDTSTIWPGQEPAVVVDQFQPMESAMVSGSIANEVQGPALRRSLRHLQCHAIPPGPLATFLGANRQAMFDLAPVRALVVHRQFSPSQHCMRTQVSGAPVPGRQLLHALDRSVVAFGQRSVVPHGSRQAEIRQARRSLPPAWSTGCPPPVASPWASQCPCSRSFIAEMSNTWSATIRLSLTFSASKARSRTAPPASRPPYVFRQL